MGYYDGNTVTALWNYAQHFAMSDNAYTDTYGPSTPGALEVVSGQTNGMQIVATTKKPSTVAAVPITSTTGQGGVTMINDVDPGYDTCSVPKDQAMMAGQNIGDLLNAADITWGGFMGGFDLETKNANGTTGCKRSTYSPGRAREGRRLHPAPQLVPVLRFHRQPDARAPQLAWPRSATASSPTARRDPANHEYDSARFLRRGEGRQFPGGVLHQAAGLPGRPRRLFRSARRADRHCDAGQLPAAAAGLEETPR